MVGLGMIGYHQQDSISSIECLDLSNFHGPNESGRWDFFFGPKRCRLYKLEMCPGVVFFFVIVS